MDEMFDGLFGTIYYNIIDKMIEVFYGIFVDIIYSNNELHWINLI